MSKREMNPPVVVTADKVALAIWNKTVPELLRTESIEALDEAVLANYCIAYANAMRYEVYLNEYGPTHKIGKNGFVIARPEVALMQDAWKQVRSCADRLGLSPMGRKKLNMENEPEDDFLNG